MKALIQTQVDGELLGAGGLNGSWVILSRANNTSVSVQSASVADFFSVLRSRRD